MKKNRILTIILALCLCVGLFGCESREGGESEDLTSSGFESSSTSAADESGDKAESSDSSKDGESSADAESKGGEATEDGSADISGVGSEGDVSVIGETSEESLVIDLRGQALTYIALGDSIARGYALESPETQCYPRLIADALEASTGADIGYSNYAVDGFQTGDVLELLNAGTIEGLADADLITVCIGANNILSVLIDGLMALTADMDIDFSNLMQEYYAYCFGEDKSDTAAIDSINNIFSMIDDLLKSKEFEDGLKNGIEVLKIELPQIIDKIYAANPDVKLVFMTVYSPFHGVDLKLQYISTELDLGTVSDEWVAKLNEEIVRIVGGYEDAVIVETYDDFMNSTDKLLNVGFSLVPPSFSVDPHPNKAGHRLIAKLNYDKIIEKLK